MSGAANRPGRSSRKQPPARSKPKRTRSKRRRDPLLASPLLYEQLDKRQLLAGDSQADGDQAPLLLDLPPVVSATLERLLSSGGEFSSGLWRSAPDQPSYHASNWAAALAPQQLAPRDWSSYSINTSLPGGFSGSHLKSVVPLEENNGYLVLIRQRTTGRTLSSGGSGGGPAGLGFGGGGGVVGSEQVDSLLISSIFHVATQAQAEAIDPLAFNPDSFPSRMVVTSNTQFSFRDTTAPGQLRSVAAALTYQVSLNFVWGGSWTTTTTSEAEGTTVRTVNYGSSGTVWFSGAHTYVGTVGMSPGGPHEVGFATGSGHSGVNLTSGNVTTLSHSSGSLSASGSGFGTRGLGTLTAGLHQVRNQTFFYTENSSRWLESAQRQSSLARTDAITYELLSSPQAALSYTSRQDLAPGDAGELLGFTPPSPPPSGSSSELSFVGRTSGALATHSRLSAHGHRGIQTLVNTAYSGQREIDFSSSGIDYSDTQGSTFVESGEYELEYLSPQTVSRSRLVLDYNDAGGDISLVETDVSLSYLALPDVTDEEQNLEGFIDSRGQLLSSNLERNFEYQYSKRGAAITGASSAEHPLVLAAGTSAFLNSFQPQGLGGGTSANLNLQAAPVAEADRRTNYFWEAASGNLDRVEHLAKPGKFRTRTTFHPTGQTELLGELETERQHQYESNFRSSSDWLTLLGHAPVLSQSGSAEAPQFALEEALQQGPGQFTHLQTRFANHYVAQGTGHSKDQSHSKYTPWTSGQTPPAAGGDDLSMTIGLGVDGFTVNTGERSFSTTEEVLLNQVDDGQTQTSAGYERTGTADGDHKFLRWVNKLVFDEASTGSGESSSTETDTDTPARNKSQSSGSGSQTADIAGQGYFYSLVDWDERSSAGAGASATAGTPSGLLAGTSGMNFELKYRAERKSPLSSRGADSETWAQDMIQSTFGTIDPQTGEESDQPPPPPDPTVPTYRVELGDKGEVRFEGTGEQTTSSEYQFIELAPWFDLDYNLRAWTENPQAEQPAELIRRYSARTGENVQPTKYKVNDQTTASIEPGPLGIKLVGNGPRETRVESGGAVFNPKEILNQQRFLLPTGGDRTETERIAAGALRENFSQTETRREVLEDYGSLLTFFGEINNEEQLAVVDQWLTPHERKFGVLSEELESSGMSSRYRSVTNREDLRLPEWFTGSGRNGYEGGVTSHTRSEDVTTTWEMLDRYRHAYDESGGVTTQYTPQGTQHSTSHVWTSGFHDLLYHAIDPQDQALVRTRQDGFYYSDATLVKELYRGGSQTNQLDAAGNLIAAAGELHDWSQGTGTAYAFDDSQVRKTKTGYDSYRQVVRESEDRYSASLTDTRGPGAASPVRTFLNQVSGELLWTETKEVLTPTDSLPRTTWTQVGDYADMESSAEGDPFIDGFSGGIYFQSLGYQGQPLDTSFSLTHPSGVLGSYTRDWGGGGDSGSGGGGGGQNGAGPEGDQIVALGLLNPLTPAERAKLDNSWDNFLGRVTRGLTGAGDDLLDGAASFTGGFAETLTGGLSSRFNDWMYGDIHRQNQESWFWTGGQVAGLAASFVLPGGGAQAACKASGLVRGFSAFNQGMMWAGAAESVANIASTGEVTFGDAIGLLGPLAHALGQRTGKMVSNGGCFVAGTPVALAALPQGWRGASGDPWAETTWLESFLAEEREFSAPLAMPAPEPAALALAAELTAAVRVAIEQVPLGARVQTRNPRRWEYDDSLPEPDEATWAKLSLTVQRSDGGLVDAELLRPRAWIELHGLRAGDLLPLHLAELEVSGPALVTAIEACPPIASGAGSVVTARFVTREVHRLVSVDLLGAGGELETLTGTPVHPVWSLDRGDWVPLAELTEGETLQGHTGPAIVLHLSLHQAAQPVYNLEIHGEHVYQVGELGVLVHNGNPADCPLELANAPKGTVETLKHRYGVYEVLTQQGISGTTRGAHRASANRALLKAIDGDPNFARLMGEIIGVDDVAAHMRSGRSGLLNPPGTEWHHPIDNPAVMQLLLREVHRHPQLQGILHPDNIGGFGTHF